MKITSKKAHVKLDQLKNDVIQQLKDLLTERVDFEDVLEDTVGNELIGIDSQSVFFGDLNDQQEYPIDDLSIEDAIYILELIES